MVRDGRCYFCPKQRELEDHHIIPQRFGGPDDDDNIVRVCNRCHKKLERLYDKSFYEWFGIDDETGERDFHRPCNYPGADCDKRAEVKFRPKGGLPARLRCQKHAAVALVREYIHQETRYDRKPAESIRKFWHDRVEETKTGVGVPQYLEQYYRDKLAERYNTS